MPTRFFILALLCASSFLHAQTKESFNPVTDSIAVYVDGEWRMPINTRTLFASLSATTPELADVQEVQVTQINKLPYLVFRGTLKNDPLVGYFVAVLLKETERGIYYADNLVQTCTGAPCQSCSFTQNGCVCDKYYDPENPLSTGSCNNSISLRKAFAELENGQVKKRDENKE